MRIKLDPAISLVLFLCSIGCWGQTMGLLQYDEEASVGYTLLSPVAATSTFLIDECGRLVKQWDSDRPPAQSAYLMPDGRLWRTGKVSGAFFSGGVGGSIQIFDWEGNLEWDYRYATDSFQQHHDIEPLPNGNVLLIAWSLMSMDSAIANGRDPQWLTDRGLWPDKMVEIKPTEFDQGEIIWEWKSEDHLIQDFDSTKLNYGVVQDHPELIDFNFVRTSDPPLAIPDWIHANSIDYNLELDQILLSCRKFNEIWIIDHSTTIEEAASHSGGTYGKGGDLLFRWGNPQTYRQGSMEDQKFFGQHDAHWIADHLPLGGKIMLYNNGFERPNGEVSSIDVLAPPIEPNGNYLLTDGRFGPDDPIWTLLGDGLVSFGSGRMSGVQMLPNQHLLICNADHGRVIEVSANGILLWEYISPILGRSPGEQGATPSQNNLFHAPRYSPDHEAFEGRLLEPGDPIELNPSNSLCEATAVVSFADIGFQIVNPASHVLTLFNDSDKMLLISIYNLQGVLCRTAEVQQGRNKISMENTPSGIYFAQVVPKEGDHVVTRKFVKH